ncbi:iron-siderophore ABC transporter substrate-binding protein [Devosia sp. 2618]|uniref:iron-siderophore ABC transporter substrate-binding protein n=1 Tax=Devosia sp. 2618 TaxID=3156454 RepID=UPI003392AF1A
MTIAPNLRAVLAALLLSCAIPAAAFAQDFPRTLDNAYGTTEIAAMPKRIVALSDIDFDIALALGLEPVASANAGFDGETTSTYHQSYMANWHGEPVAFFSLMSGVPFETILGLDPDLILATGAWSLDTDYERLSTIAPVVALPASDENPTWQDKTRTAAKALALETKGEQVIADIEAKFATAAAENPSFAGKTITYGVVHPDQLTYMSVEGDTSTTFFKLLGFTLPDTAAQFSADISAVSRERLDLFDADVLLFGFPFEGVSQISQADLEADPLFKRLQSVQNGHYAVVPPTVASAVGYPSPLSTAWALEVLLPELQAATR